MSGASRFPDQNMTSPENQRVTVGESFMLGDWRVEPREGFLVRGSEKRRLEPRVMSLLVALAAEAMSPVPREALERSVWGDTVVGEDALPRAVLKLRRALDDDAKRPRYLETLPRRGYRLLHQPKPISSPGGFRPRPRAFAATLAGMAVVAVVAAAAITGTLREQPATEQPAGRLERAHDYYHQFSREGNEAAAALYRTLIESEPDNAEAHAGLANAMLQRVVRWPAGQATVVREHQSVTDTLVSERLDSPWAQASIADARWLATRAVQLDPNLGEARKALGLARSLAGDPAGAREAYEQALRLDPGLWSALVNLAELDLIDGNRQQAIDRFEAAWGAMQAAYSETPQRIGGWLAELGVLLGELHKAENQADRAEFWFRRVLETQPWHGDATLGLVALLNDRGQTMEAASLCGELALRIGPEKRCEPFDQAPNR